MVRTHEMARRSERRRSALREKSREVTDIEIVMIAEEDVWRRVRRAHCSSYTTHFGSRLQPDGEDLRE